MTNPDLKALAARMQEAQAEEQRELLEAAFGVVKRPPLIAWVCSVTGRRDYTSSPDFIRFSAMLDAEAYESAALMLVPERHRWSLHAKASGSLPFTYTAEICSRRTGLEKPTYSYMCSTPALAIASAALLAHVEISK